MWIFFLHLCKSYLAQVTRWEYLNLKFTGKDLPSVSTNRQIQEFSIACTPFLGGQEYRKGEIEILPTSETASLSMIIQQICEGICLLLNRKLQFS